LLFAVAVAVALAFLVVIPEGDLLFALAAASMTTVAALFNSLQALSS
jgi:hypothetical protein